jgi:hypothetical protein
MWAKETEWGLLEDVWKVAERWAKKFEDEASQAKRRGWEQKLEQSALGGAGKLHRWTKPVAVWKPTVKQPGKGQKPGRCGPLEEVEAALCHWSAIWKVDQIEQLEERPWDQAGESDLAPITVEEVERAALAFKETTGMGSDDFHPRWVVRLSLAGKQAITDMLNAAERSRVWPAHSSTLMVWLALKVDGGHRPLVLLPSLIRLWEAARHSVLDQWQRTTEKEWDATRMVGGAEEAAWETLIMQEAGDGGAGGAEEAGASVVLDLAKAFDTVSLITAWRWCLYWGMGPSTQAAGRVIVDGCASRPVRTVAAIPAGSKWCC